MTDKKELKEIDVKEKLKEFGSKISVIEKSIEDKIAERPILSTAIGVGIGIGLGFIIGRSIKCHQG